MRTPEALEPRAMLNAASLINLDIYRTDSRFSGIDGTGQSVAIIDTGVDLNHPYFGADANADGVADRIVFQYDFADRDGNASDGSSTSHGSHVAGIVGSSDATNYGVAPGVNLVILKVFRDDGGGAEMKDIESALQWVEQNAAAYNIAAVNLSLGSGNYSTPQTDFIISDEFERLDALGVIVVAAAGNDFFTEGSAPGVSYPAADPHVLAVSAVWADDYGLQSFEGGVDNTTSWDRVAGFSQRDPLLTDIFAPGGLITSADRNGGAISRRGTSMATPFISGLAAIAQQLSLRETGKRLNMAEFRDLLRSTAITIHDGDDEDDNVTNTGANYPRVNVLSFAEALLKPSGQPTLTIENLVVPEGSGPLASAQVKVRLTHAPTTEVTVAFNTLDGTAKAGGGDYVSTSGTLVFLPGGPIEQTINVLVSGDILPESDENFAVDLSNANGAKIGRARGVVVIEDDDETLSYHNSLDARDVNGDRRVTALDALIVINEINARGSRTLPNPPTPKTPWYYYDVNNDARITALDALVVINWLNSHPVTAPAPLVAAESEPGFAPASSDGLGSPAPVKAVPLGVSARTTVASHVADAVFALASADEHAPFACNNRSPVYRETYRRQGLPRFSS